MEIIWLSYSAGLVRLTSAEYDEIFISPFEEEGGGGGDGGGQRNKTMEGINCFS